MSQSRGGGGSGRRDTALVWVPWSVALCSLAATLAVRLPVARQETRPDSILLVDTRTRRVERIALPAGTHVDRVDVEADGGISLGAGPRGIRFDPRSGRLAATDRRPAPPDCGSTALHVNGRTYFADDVMGRTHVRRWDGTRCRDVLQIGARNVTFISDPEADAPLVAIRDAGLFRYVRATDSLSAVTEAGPELCGVAAVGLPLEGGAALVGVRTTIDDMAGPFNRFFVDAPGARRRSAGMASAGDEDVLALVRAGEAVVAVSSDRAIGFDASPRPQEPSTQLPDERRDAFFVGLSDGRVLIAGGALTTPRRVVVSTLVAAKAVSAVVAALLATGLLAHLRRVNRSTEPPTTTTLAHLAFLGAALGALLAPHVITRVLDWMDALPFVR